MPVDFDPDQSLVKVIFIFASKPAFFPGFKNLISD
jgi:hypothetical protein